MKGDKKKRVEKLEKAKEDSQVIITVNWDENPEPPGEGVQVVRWEDEDYETD